MFSCQRKWGEKIEICEGNVTLCSRQAVAKGPKPPERTYVKRVRNKLRGWKEKGLAHYVQIGPTACTSDPRDGLGSDIIY